MAKRYPDIGLQKRSVRVVDHPTANRDEDTTNQAVLAISKGSPK
jgi:hypothetical protein